MTAPLWGASGAIGAVLALVYLIGGHRRRADEAAFAVLARAARMNYSPIDRFDLTRRLQHSPNWAAGLIVCDVIYGAAGTERRFVLTAIRRATPDDPARRWVVACVEPLDHRELREVGEPVAARNRAGIANAYAMAVASLVERA